jgi:hypothetical protein
MSAVPILLEELGRDDPAAVDRAFPKDERFEAAKKILHESAWLLE